MIKKIHLLLLALVVLSFLNSGCKKIRIDVTRFSTNCDGSIWIETGYYSRGHPIGYVNVYFFDSHKNFFNVGKITIGKYMMNLYNDNNYSLQGAGRYLDSMSGNEVPISIEGNKDKGFEPFNQIVYVPAKIEVKTPLNNTYSANWIVDGKEIDLNWVPDKHNEKMVVELQGGYIPVGGQGSARYVEEIEDNGHFTIPWSKLKDLYKRTAYQLSLYRYSTHIVNAGSKKVALIACNKLFLGNYGFQPVTAANK